MASHGPIAVASILVVNDDRTIGETIERLLLRRGFDVVSSTGVKEALERLRHEQFDLIIMNLHRSDNRDLDLLEQIKASGGDKLVLIAGENNDQTIDVKNPGASEYIKEPFQLEELAKTVEQALARRRELQFRTDVNSSDSRKGSINKNVSNAKSGSSLSGAPVARQSGLILTGRSPAIRKIITT